MTLGEFAVYIDQFPDDTIFPFGISRPLFWRCDAREVMFTMFTSPMSKKEVMEEIKCALTKRFKAWDGTLFEYNDDTPVHFGDDLRRWSDEEYVASWIAHIEKLLYKSQEERLVKLAFRPTED
jgi:hypothetical protein